MIAEACESDGTLVNYHVPFGVIHNITRDHGEVSTVMEQFATFATNTKTLLVNAACPNAMQLADKQRTAKYMG